MINERTRLVVNFTKMVQDRAVIVLNKNEKKITTYLELCAVRLKISNSTVVEFKLLKAITNSFTEVNYRQLDKRIRSSVILIHSVYASFKETNTSCWEQKKKVKDTLM